MDLLKQNHTSRELRDVIINYITSLRPFGGKICLRQTAASSDKTKINFVFLLLLAAIDFAFTSLDVCDFALMTEEIV